MAKNVEKDRVDVSVVMCTYNGVSYIDEQLSSIVNQTYILKEVLIFDDASTDGTWEKLQQFKKRYPVLTIISNANTLGFCRNFQQALLAATGEIIAIADQDDIWERNKIRRLLEAWTEDTPLIYSDSIRFKDQVPASPKATKNNRRYSGTDARKLFFYNTVSGHSMLVKRSFLQNVMPFEEGIYYDWWMAVVASYHGGVSYLNEILVYQRVHEDNASVSKVNTRGSNFFTYREMVFTHIQHFIRCKQMPENHQKFARDLIVLYQRRQRGMLNKWQLAYLIFVNRTILFHNKMRKLALFSFTKHALRWAVK